MPSFHTYLSEPNVRDRAVDYVRAQLRRRPTADDKTFTPLTAESFCRWVNQTLLPSEAEARGQPLKPIGASTAFAWLAKLGFAHKQNNKSLYYDGHEREDNVTDRMVQCVNVLVLAEVTVKFNGTDCEDVVWPQLWPAVNSRSCGSRKTSQHITRTTTTDRSGLKLARVRASRKKIEAR